MQFQVPQFIETEDKIIGPLTLRQFAYVLAAAIPSVALYFIIQTWLWAIISIFLGGAASGLAFGKINGRSLINIIVSAFGFYWSPQTYVWQPEHPEIKKDGGAIKQETPALENILSGLALRKAWQNLQTGTKFSGKQFFNKTQEVQKRYQIFQKASGDRQAAKRIDYR